MAFYHYEDKFTWKYCTLYICIYEDVIFHVEDQKAAICFFDLYKIGSEF